MSMHIWVCLTRRRTSDILELTIKKNAAPSGGVFFSKVANGLCRLGTEPAADYNSSFTLTNSLIICQSAGSHSTLSSSAGKSHRAASLWSQRRKEPPVAVPPASEATSRGAEHSLLLPRFSCFRLHPAHKKRDPKRSLSFVELEKKGTACGRSAFRLWSWRRKELPVAVPPASEATSRGAEHSLLLPRFSCFRLHPATKKETPKGLFRLWSWRESNPRPNK